MFGVFPIFAFIMVRTGALLEQKAKLCDTRINIMNEILAGFRVVRFYGWEPSFLKRISSVRAAEIDTLRSSNITQSMFILTFMLMPIWVSLASFAAYTGAGHPLSPSVCFGSLALFAMLRWALLGIPRALSSIVSGGVAADRIQKFLMHPELPHDTVVESCDRDGEAPNAIEIVNGTFSWDSNATHGDSNATASAAASLSSSAATVGAADDTVTASATVAATDGAAAHAAAAAPEVHAAFSLVDITLRVPRGSLTAVVGTVGAGKSSVAMAVLGEMRRVSGAVHCRGPVGYVAQTSWIQVREPPSLMPQI